MTAIFAIMSDRWRNRPLMMSVCTFMGFFLPIVLAVWGSRTRMPDGPLWFAHLFYRTYVPYGPISMTWAKYVLRFLLL